MAFSVLYALRGFKKHVMRDGHLIVNREGLGGLSYASGTGPRSMNIGLKFILEGMGQLEIQRVVRPVGWTSSCWRTPKG